MANPLTNVEKYAIQGMIAEDKTSNDIAEEMGLDQAVVLAYMDQLLDSIKKLEEQTQKNRSVPQDQTKKLMATKLGKDGKPIASIMTPAASEVSDSVREQNKGTRSRTSKGAIYKIKEQTIE